MTSKQMGKKNTNINFEWNITIFISHLLKILINEK